MKKFLSVMILVAVLVIVGQASKVEAAEVYMGNYSDGTAVYLLTQTVQRKVWARTYGYTCSVRAGRDYLDYTFYLGSRGVWKYENSEGYEGNCYDGSSPVAANICNYLRNNY